MAINTEVVILKSLMNNQEFFAKTFKCLSEKVFKNKSCAQAYKYIKDGVNTNNKVININDLELLYENDSNLSIKNKVKMDELVENINELASDFSFDTLCSTTIKYIKKSLASLALLNGADINDTDGDLSSFIAEIVAIDSISFDTKLGTSIYDTSRIHRYSGNRIETGHKIFDQLTGGGPQIGTMSVIYAGPHTGKSQLKVDIANSAFLSGKNVLYVTGEMTEDQTLQRSDSNLLEIPTYKINPTDLGEEIFKTAINTIKTTLKEKYDRDVHYEVFYAEANTFSANDLVDLCEEYKLRENKVFDIIFIDSLNLMAPNDRSIKYSNNSASFFSPVVKEFRGAGNPKKLNVPIVTSWHIHAGSVNNIMNGAEVTLNDAGEYRGVSKDADFIFSAKMMYVKNESIYHDMLFSTLIDEDVELEEKHKLILKLVTLKTRFNTVVGDSMYVASYPSIATYELLWANLNARGDNDDRSKFKTSERKRSEKKSNKITRHNVDEINKNDEDKNNINNNVEENIDNFYNRDRKRRR